MAQRLQRSLRHEYEIYVEEEIENYKESIPRNALLSIGDEAVARLATGDQILLTELVLCDEVNRIISRRLRLPKYETWRRARMKLARELRRPEHWGLTADHPAVRAISETPEGRVLVAGDEGEHSTLYLAANGCSVTTVHGEAETLERVMRAATDAGLAERIRAIAADLNTWEPDTPLSTVICAPAALARLTMKSRRRLIEALQSATAAGGIHLLQARASTGRGRSPTVDELRKRYHGWSVTVDDAAPSGMNTFTARKEIA